MEARTDRVDGNDAKTQRDEFPRKGEAREEHRDVGVFANSENVSPLWFQINVRFRLGVDDFFNSDIDMTG